MTRKTFLSFAVVDACLVVAVYLTRFLSASRYLQKWDSVQFALALHDFDITRHQPHPPGYPGYIALGWIARQFVQDDNQALLVVGTISAMVLAVALHRFGRTLFGTRGGITAGILAAFNPLLWYFSSIALPYMVGITFAVLSVWAAYSFKGKLKWLVPLIAGLATVCWTPAGILVFPVCLLLFLRKEPDQSDETTHDGLPLTIPIAGFIAMFIIPILIGYLPVIGDTGGFGQYLGQVQSESSKHVFRFGNWTSSPLTEFIENTGALAELFRKGLGMGRWLFLALLLPVAGEIGTKPKKVLALLPLAIASFAALQWSSDPGLRSLGIVVFTTAVIGLLPNVITDEGRLRRYLFTWWLVPGLLLFVLVHVNYVGVLIIFLPPLLMMIAWGIERFAEFMVQQTVREEHEIRKPVNVDNPDTEKVQSGVKGPDLRVGKLVAVVLIILMVLHDIGVFTGTSDEDAEPVIRENWAAIIDVDTEIEQTLEAINQCGIPEQNLMVLGGEYNYRHWTYYLPEAETIWTKYLLYMPVRANRPIWVSRDRVQEKVIPETSPSPLIDTVLEARFPIEQGTILVVFPEEIERMAGRVDAVPLMSENGETLCYLVDPGDASSIVFGDGVFRLE